MKIKHAFVSILSLATASIAITLPAFAYPATLTAVEPGSEINVRSAPTTESYSPHYGLAGDRVEVIDTTQGNDGYVWHYVRFNNSGVEGWVRGDLIRSDRFAADAEYDRNGRTRQADLQKDFARQFVNRDIDQVMQRMRHQGYAPSDDGNGQIYFGVEQGSFEVTLNYSSRDYKVDSVVVRASGIIWD